MHLAPSRAALLAAAADRGADVFIAYGDDDFFLLRLRETSAWHLEALERQGGVHLTVVPGLDHPLMNPVPRFQLLDTMTAHLVSRFGSARTVAEAHPTGR
jgi:hypothetical protein